MPFRQCAVAVVFSLVLSLGARSGVCVPVSSGGVRVGIGGVTGSDLI